MRYIFDPPPSVKSGESVETDVANKQYKVLRGEEVIYIGKLIVLPNPEVPVQNSKGCQKRCPKCGEIVPFYVYDCPKCHYDFN